MNQIISYFKNYFHEEFNIGYFLTVSIFLGISLAVNYSFNFEYRVVHSIESRFFQFAAYCCFYGLPFLFTTIIYPVFYRRRNFLKDRGFWILGSIIIITLSFEASTRFSTYAFIEYVTMPFADLFTRCFNNFSQAVIWFIPAFGYWYLVDKDKVNIYGFSLKGFKLSPYFLMLSMLILPVFWASFQSDFMAAYPRFGNPYIYSDGSFLMYIPVFELFYGVAYVSVEFFFRGFMVMALGRYMGKGAVIPMAAVYCFIHFQKPFLEAFSSIFGGFILGVISSYGGSILGGIIIHLGIAWLMEVAAFSQVFFFNR